MINLRGAKVNEPALKNDLAIIEKIDIDAQLLSDEASKTQFLQACADSRRRAFHDLCWSGVYTVNKKPNYAIFTGTPTECVDYCIDHPELRGLVTILLI